MGKTVRSQPPEITFAYITEPEMTAEIRQLFLEYVDSLNIDLAFQNFEAEFQALPGKYGPPDGRLILALADGKSAGCIALHKLSEEICEMKRLYVRGACRGLGIGGKLVALVIKEAKKLNYAYMRLDTLATMQSAQKLYSAFGFYDVEPYVYNPIEGTRFLELKLKD